MLSIFFFLTSNKTIQVYCFQLPHQLQNFSNKLQNNDKNFTTTFRRYRITTYYTDYLTFKIHKLNELSLFFIVFGKAYYIFTLEGKKQYEKKKSESKKNSFVALTRVQAIQPTKKTHLHYKVGISQYLDDSPSIDITYRNIKTKKQTFVRQNINKQ